MGNRIVVGVDGSSTAQRAFRWAVEEAGFRRAELDLVFVWSADSHLVDLTELPTQQELEAAALQTVDETLEDAGLPNGDLPVVNPIVTQGSAKEVLLEVATGADLLVVGSRGMGGVKGLLLGSVSLHCVTHADCPVVVVHGTESA